MAESCTGGLVGARITDVAGASQYFEGGVVAYSNKAKEVHLGITPDILRRDGAVSRTVAEAMAIGVARRFGVQVGVAVTGVAGPTGGSEEKPVGTVWIAVSLSGTIHAVHHRFEGSRVEIRERSAEAVLALVLTVVDGKRE